MEDIQRLSQRERTLLQSEVDKLMNSFKEQAGILGKELFIFPIDSKQFHWLLHNPEKNRIGITTIKEMPIPNGPIHKAHKKSEQFFCFIIRTKEALYYETEGFTLSDILNMDNVFELVPAKDILSKIL